MVGELSAAKALRSRDESGISEARDIINVR
jgi:hypothetical protein